MNEIRIRFYFVVDFVNKIIQEAIGWNEKHSQIGIGENGFRECGCCCSNEHRAFEITYTGNGLWHGMVWR